MEILRMDDVLIMEKHFLRVIAIEHFSATGATIAAVGGGRRWPKLRLCFSPELRRTACLTLTVLTTDNLVLIQKAEFPRAHGFLRTLSVGQRAAEEPMADVGRASVGRAMQAVAAVMIGRHVNLAPGEIGRAHV